MSLIMISKCLTLILVEIFMDLRLRESLWMREMYGNIEGGLVESDVDNDRHSF